MEDKKVSILFEPIFIGKGHDGFLENYIHVATEDAQGFGGNLYMCIEILRNSLDAKRMSHAIFETLKESYYGSRNSDPYARFEDALKAVNSLIRDFRSERESGFIGDFNAVIAVSFNNEIHMTTCGHSDVYLIRKRLVTIVSEGLADEPNDKDLFVNIASGSLEPNDYVLFSTTRILRYATKSDFGKVFGRDGVKMALKELNDLVATETLTRIGVIGLNLKAEKKKVEDLSANNVAEPQVDYERHESIEATHEKRESIIDRIQDEWFYFKRRFKNNSNKKHIVYGIVGLSVLLLIILFWSGLQRQDTEFLQKQEELLVEAETLITQAEQRSFDKDQANEFLNQAREKAIQVFNSGVLRARAGQVLDGIQSASDAMDDTRRIEVPNLFVDLSEYGVSLVRGVIRGDGVLYAFDNTRVFEIIGDRVQEPVTVVENDILLEGAYYEENNSLVMLTSDNRVVEYKDGLVNFFDNNDGEWEVGVDIATFSDRIYLLDPNDSQVWKYRKLRDNEFGSAEASFSDDQIGDPLSVAIDGSIYVLSGDEFIYEFYQGSKRDFGIAELPVSAFESTTELFTLPDYRNIFVVDSLKNKILVLLKDDDGGAKYSHQYLLEDIPEIQDIYVSSDEKIYIASGSGVYLIDLRTQ